MSKESRPILFPFPLNSVQFKQFYICHLQYGYYIYVSDVRYNWDSKPFYTIILLKLEIFNILQKIVSFIL